MVFCERASYAQYCLINNTKKCRGDKIDGKFGELVYWGQKEYHSFFSAFLRNSTLVDAFVNKQKLEEFNASQLEVI